MRARKSLRANTRQIETEKTTTISSQHLMENLSATLIESHEYEDKRLWTTYRIPGGTTTDYPSLSSFVCNRVGRFFGLPNLSDAEEDLQILVVRTSFTSKADVNFYGVLRSS